MIQAKNLVKSYRGRRVVDGISLEMNRGEIVGLLGPNGAGKTTTFYMIVGLVRPQEGHVFLDNAEVTGLPMHKRARLGLGYLPQEPSIFKKLTVEENITILWEILKTIPRSQYDAKLAELLGEMGLTALRKSKGYELSGGEKRRVEIVRALAVNPSFILLDEPFAGIDPIAVSEIQNIIRSLKQRNLGIIITDHNVRETLSITDRAYIVHEGKILLSGPSDQIADDPVARKFYLGDKFRM
jgi:lipopolysaccharide export system ATP-binding protein